MKPFLSAIALCSFLLIFCTLVVVRSVDADGDDLVDKMLRLPAPPPPNPLVPFGSTTERPPDFYAKHNPPKDDAPIDEIMDYWSRQSGNYQQLRYNPKPSDRVLDRIIAEIEKDKDKAINFVNLFNDSEKGAELLRRIYREKSAAIEDIADEYGEDGLYSLKYWLKTNTDEFSDELAAEAEKAGPEGEYVANQEQLLALSKVDWDKAAPMVSRLYNDVTQPAGKVLATWALYKHALQTDSFGDIERYREELKRVVEDKKATGGMRDLAFDALVSETDFAGRDDWYYGLLEDETLADVRVNGVSYTGLTTLVLYQPDEKYRAKMLELLKSGNPSVRQAAIRNLAVKMENPDPEVVRALLPWLEDPKWAEDVDNSRRNLIMALGKLQIPESVPGLVALLDEKVEATVPDMGAYAGNTMANSANIASNVPDNSNIAWGEVEKMGTQFVYPYRSASVAALEKQASFQAVPALKRLLADADIYSQSSIVRAIFASGGFTLAEQVHGVESLAAMTVEESGVNSNSNGAKTIYYSVYNIDAKKYPDRLPIVIGMEISRQKALDELVRELLARIANWERRDPSMAAELHSIISKWEGSVVNIMLLNDVKTGKADFEIVTRLLSERKMLRENHSTDIYALRSGGPTATAIAACLLEHSSDYDAILNGGDTSAKTALFACGRLIRAALPLGEAAKALSGPDKRLAKAAELFLESEDSAEARGIVLSRYPNQARIFGARRAFTPAESLGSEYLSDLFKSVHSGPLYYYTYFTQEEEPLEQAEKRVQDEVLANEDLLGVYSYGPYTVRIFGDKVLFAWGDDPARFRERAMAQSEFDVLKRYFVSHNVDGLKPFLRCGSGCTSKQLLMVGRSGGRRVFTDGDSGIEFFKELDEFFESLKREPGVLKYAAASKMPGIRIEYAHDNFIAETVWADGDDVRVMLTNKETRKQVQKQVAEAQRLYYESEEEMASDARPSYLVVEERLWWEGIAWYKLTDEGIGGTVAEPGDVELMTNRGGSSLPQMDEQWKARTANFELRTDETALYKVTGGNAVKMLDGYFAGLVVTPNGRWAFATHYSGEGGIGLVRINLANKQMTRLTTEKLPVYQAIAYVPALNKILAGDSLDGEHDHGPPRRRAETDDHFWIDPDTGTATKAAGTLGPLLNQTFRSLQAGPGTNEFWAAISDPKKDETRIGIYDTGKLTFTLKLTIPDIQFESMEMWVNTAQNKVYFVYDGHLLSVPLPK